MRNVGLNIGSTPAFTDGQSAFQWPQWMTTWSPIRRLVTSLPTFQTMPEASLPPMWNPESSGQSLSRVRALMTSTGEPRPAHTLL